MKNTVKPCRICGGEGHHFCHDTSRIAGHEGYSVVCEDCDNHTATFPTWDDATQAWNEQNTKPMHHYTLKTERHLCAGETFKAHHLAWRDDHGHPLQTLCITTRRNHAHVHLGWESLPVLRDNAAQFLRKIRRNQQQERGIYEMAR